MSTIFYEVLKEEMKKFNWILAVVMVLVMVSGVFAASALSDSDISGDVKDLVKHVAEKKGVDINPNVKVKKEDLNNLPKEVDLKNIDDTNLAVYSVNSGEGKPVYVLTLSQDTYEKLQETQDYKRMLLNFGTSSVVKSSEFLETATGVQGSVEKGYVMMRDGSITGLSTNLNVVLTSETNEPIEIMIYKNGKPSGFENSLNSYSSEVQKDYDIQSEGTIDFLAGDVMSVYVIVPEGVSIEDVTTLLEITTSE